MLIRILLIEDHQWFGKRIKDFFSRSGYTVDWVCNGIEADANYWAQSSLDLVVMDLDVPGFNWRNWLKDFKELTPSTPILVLSGNAEASHTLNIGVDAYISKRLLKRGKLLATAQGLFRQKGRPSSNILTVKDITIDLDSHSIIKDGMQIILARAEFALLHKLMKHIGEVVSHDQLIQCLSETQVVGTESNIIDVCISSLRAKLGNDYIQTQWGVGYVVPSELAAKNISVDLKSNMVIKNGLKITLTRRECVLLHNLIIQSGKVMRRNQLIRLLFEAKVVGRNSLEVHMHNLRQKLKTDLDRASPTLIESVRGVGYRIAQE